MTPQFFTAPMPAIRAPRRGIKELGRSSHLALWGCYHNDVGFWCRSTITGAVVGDLKRDPHGLELTIIEEHKLIRKNRFM